jgi:hypothetical protein
MATFQTTSNTARRFCRVSRRFLPIYSPRLTAINASRFNSNELSIERDLTT